MTPNDGPAPDATKPREPAPTGLRPQRLWMFVMLALAANYLMMRTCSPESRAITIPYTVFKQQVEAGNVVSVTGVGDTIRGTLKTELRYPPEATPARPYAQPSPPAITRTTPLGYPYSQWKYRTSPARARSR